MDNIGYAYLLLASNVSLNALSIHDTFHFVIFPNMTHEAHSIYSKSAIAIGQGNMFMDV